MSQLASALPLGIFRVCFAALMVYSLFDTAFGSQDLQATGRAFAWHQHLNENTDSMGLKYRAFVTACQAGPVSAPGGPEDQT